MSSFYSECIKFRPKIFLLPNWHKIHRKVLRGNALFFYSPHLVTDFYQYSPRESPASIINSTRLKMIQVVCLAKLYYIILTCLVSVPSYETRLCAKLAIPKNVLLHALRTGVKGKPTNRTSTPIHRNSLSK